jgi:hypothetical protein
MVIRSKGLEYDHVQHQQQQQQPTTKAGRDFRATSVSSVSPWCAVAVTDWRTEGPVGILGAPQTRRVRATQTASCCSRSRADIIRVRPLGRQGRAGARAERWTGICPGDQPERASHGSLRSVRRDQSSDGNRAPGYVHPVLPASKPEQQLGTIRSPHQWRRAAVSFRRPPAGSSGHRTVHHCVPALQQHGGAATLVATSSLTWRALPAGQATLPRVRPAPPRSRSAAQPSWPSPEAPQTLPP